MPLWREYAVYISRLISQVAANRYEDGRLR
jgi:hypothetical protein